MTEVAFRVDASVRMGTGHVCRCLALADRLRSRGIESLFVHRLHHGHMRETIESRGYTVKPLSRPEGKARLPEDGEYAGWLGVEAGRDAAETRAALMDQHIDWLVVDHYSLGADWHSSVRAAVDRIAVVDDLANRVLECDLLVDPNYFRCPEERYRGRLPTTARRLMGPRYALLQPEYALARKLLRPRRGPLSRVVIYYGGSDLRGETLRAIRVLELPEFRGVAADIVVGVSSPSREEVIERARSRPMTTVHEPRRSLLDLSIDADLALGGGGTTTWERCAIGLPAIVTAVAANQVPFNEALAEDGIIRFLGPGEDVEDDDLTAALSECLARPDLLETMAKRAWNVTDGLGAERISQLLLPPPTSMVGLQPTETRRTNLFVDAAPTSSSTDPAVRLLTVSSRDLPIGLVQFDQRSKYGLSIRFEPDFDTASRRRHVLAMAATEWKGSGMPWLGLQAEVDSARSLKISVISDRSSWINEFVPDLLAGWLEEGYRVRWVHRPTDLTPGDLCFLLGCGQILEAAELQRHIHNLVVHASDLPKGRGWSPMTWQVLDGRNRFTVSLLEAAEKVDAGVIYSQAQVELKGTELLTELRSILAETTLDLCCQFTRGYPESANEPKTQVGEATYYPRRTPADSELDPEQSLASQFDLLRVVDDNRYPAFFHWRGLHYRIRIDRM